MPVFLLWAKVKIIGIFLIGLTREKPCDTIELKECFRNLLDIKLVSIF